MKIPKKITPDNLKHTIVQVRYNAGIHPELVIGTFYHLFSETFNFVASASPSPSKELKVAELIVSINKGFFIDKSEKIKIEVGDSAIVFNIYREYMGWDKYFSSISPIIIKLYKEGFIKEITRIGIRYISQFDNVNLVENLKMNFSIDILDKKLESSQIKTQYSDEHFTIILTLINKVRQKIEALKEVKTSVIDIDVIQTFSELIDFQSALNAIEKGHQKQKIIFFSLLQPEFLKTLKPEY
ncbi:hypothetical protein BH23BAC1_BH23BAC1_50240 [soil metagenome]